jgi:hypothetical protein
MPTLHGFYSEGGDEESGQFSSYTLLVKKKLQHYVFRAYLKPWSENDKIYCLRGGRVFPSNLKGVACERFFYKLQELTPKEIQLIDRAVIEPVPEPSKAYLRRFLALYSWAPNVKRHFDGGADSTFPSVLNELIVNFAENYHEKIEGSLLVFLKSMLAGNTEFYLDSKQAAEFLYALSVQYTRTKRVREAALSQIGTTFNGCDTRRVWSALNHIMAMIIGERLYIDRQRFDLVLIDNQTDTPFITADQPIINLHAAPTGEPPDKLEFFYPLSPQRAMLLVENSNKKSNQSISAVSVNSYNIRMIQNSHEQVFSNSEEYLTSIRHLVCDNPGDQRLKT